MSLVTHHWATPVLRTNITTSHAPLLNALHALILADGDSTSSDAAALTRETLTKLHDAGDSTALALSELLYTHVVEYMATAFGVDVYRPGVVCEIEPFYVCHQQYQYVRYHNHTGSMFTGVLYVDVCDGQIQLLDPRSNANRNMGILMQTDHFSPYTTQPVSGDLLLFPSYVYHVGTPNMHPRIPRVLVVFDVRVFMEQYE